MHVWYHTKELPQPVRYRVNFRLTFSLWDSILKTNYITHDNRDIELGFEGDKHFPKDFYETGIVSCILKKKKNSNSKDLQQA